MDFRRVQQILIIVFILLDIFLLTIYLGGMNEVTESSTNVQESIETRLKKDGISFKKLSTSHKEGYYLSATQTNFTQEKSALLKQMPKLSNATVTYGEQSLKVTLNHEFSTVKRNYDVLINLFISNSELVVNHQEYKYSSVLSQTTHYPYEAVFTQYYEELPFYDEAARMKVTIQDDDDNLNVTDYTQKHLDNIEPLREKSTLISEKEAVSTLYENSEIPANSTIEWMRLGYTQILKVNEKTVYVPVWYVAVKSNNKTSISLVNAFNRNILTNSQVPTVN